MKRLLQIWGLSLFLILSIPMPGLAATALPTKFSAVEATNIIHRVDTIAALRALSGGPGKRAAQAMGYYAAGDGGGGRFLWNSVDFSAQVSAQIISGVQTYGIYCPPNSDPTGASGAWVRDHDNTVTVKMFGAVGDGTTDDYPAIQGAIKSGISTVKLGKPQVAYRINTGIGGYAPGSFVQNLVGQGKYISILHFYGTGPAVILSGDGQSGNFKVISKGAGQSGVIVRGGIAGKISMVDIEQFDGTGYQVGTTAAAVAPNGIGAYFVESDKITVLNNITPATVQIHVVGQQPANSNANVFRDCFAKGAATTQVWFQGNANIFIGGDMEPNNSLSPVARVMRFSGTGNKVEKTYVETSGGTYPALFAWFESTAQSNRVSQLYMPGQYVNNQTAMILDEGIANDFSPYTNGYNFSMGAVKESQENLVPNAGFVGYNAATGLIPGWTITAGAVTIDPAVIHGGKHSLKIATVAGKASAQNFVATYIPSTRRAIATVPIELLRGKTVYVAVWCLSSTPGYGSVRMNVTNGISVGTNSHSGSGQWELLVAGNRVEQTATEVSIQLRQHRDNLDQTGEAWFSEPFMIIGNTLPVPTGFKKLNDVEAVMAGRIVLNAPLTLAVDSTTPDVSEGNFFKEANTVAKTITNFVGGKEGQEIKILTTSNNTSVGNTGTIATTTGTTKLLAINTVYQFIYDGTKWREF